LRLRMLFLAFVLLTAAATLIAMATPLLPVGGHTGDITAFDFRNTLLDVSVTPNGDGDPLPGGGVPR
jgi:hypothetical protein